MSTMKKRVMGKIIVITMAMILVLANAVTVFAHEALGDGTTSYANFNGSLVNTFAQKLDLAEAYIDWTKIKGDNVTLKIERGDVAKNHGSSGDGDLAVSFEASKLTKPYDGEDVSAEWYYDYKDAIILPDGSKKTLRLKYELKHIENGAPAGTTMDGWFPLSNGADGPNPGHNIRGGIVGSSTKQWAYQATMDVTLSILEGNGDFLFSANGINLWQSGIGDTSAWRGLNLRDLDDRKYTRESITLPTADYYYPNRCPGDPNYPDGNKTTKDENTIYSGRINPDTNKPQNWGNDGKYNSGFATILTSGNTITVKELGGVNDKGEVVGLNMYFTLGDLQHRIWSGSGPNGKIETFKKGSTGDVLPGGEFDGDIPSRFPEGKDALKRYVVPDAKAGVKYIMTPHEGYFAKEVCVDDKTIKIPMDQPVGKTWEFDAGVLRHEGDDIYTFIFTKPNAEDHNIYVTWRTTPAGDDVTSIDGKGQTQKGTPIFKPGADESFRPGEYTLLDDSGKPVDSITKPGEGKYTINKETGEVTFVPEPNYVGTATGVTVRATQTDGQSTTARYTPTVVETEQTKTVSRNITFTYKTEDGKTASKTVTQTLTFKRTGKYNKETGQVEYPDWEPQTFPAVKAPKIKGWKPNMAEAPALTVTNPDQNVSDVHIVYKKVVKKAVDSDKDKSKGADTGDSNNLLIWICVLTAALIGSGAVVRRRIKTRD